MGMPVNAIIIFQCRFFNFIFFFLFVIFVFHSVKLLLPIIENQISMVRKTFIICVSILTVISSSGQTVSQRLQQAFNIFETDAQLKTAISSLYVIDAKTGQVVFNKNSMIGMAPASTQKIITAATAFELLGDGYGYKTWFYLDGPIRHDTLLGNLIIKGTGDPTLGSPRYEETKKEVLLGSIIKMIRDKNIRVIAKDIIIDESAYETASVPDGWIWQDIGNYYGAGAYAFNWNENQYDMILKAGPNEGDPVEITKTEPELEISALQNELKAGATGSGDNAYLYIPPYSYNGFVRGTIPPGANRFIISGSIPYPARQFLADLGDTLTSAGILVNGKYTTSLEMRANGKPLKYSGDPFSFLVSPSLVQMTKWFLTKSINLYGEAFIKTIAFERKGFGSTSDGLMYLKDFWKQNGIDDRELNMCDGSGLSPQDRVTTHAQVMILKYARQQPWFNYYFDAFPEYNNMKMKSGTIKDVKAFCGYHTAKNGREYIFSFLVNNYNGSTSDLVNKMYKVLNILK
jgi:D-alanyl-D-alanine carboxypeptidase/D-alanyl-D-alanine-endopeptidase (penicillin-binding protein 4)